MASMRAFGWGWTLCLVVGSSAALAGEPLAAKPAPRTAAFVPGGREIHQAFRGKTVPPRMKLLQQLRRAGLEGDRAEQITALTEELQRKFSRMSADAVDLQLLRQLAAYPSEDAGRALESFLPEADVRVALTALQGLLTSDRIPDWERIQALTKHADYDKVYALRRAVIAGAERTGSPDAGDLLVNTVAEADGQLKYEAAQSLTRLTGQKFGGHGDQWREWWQTARNEFQPISPELKPTGSLSERIAWDKPVPEFFGVPIYARRLLFILDRSESMASSVDGELRIDRARQELEKAVLKLPPDAEFNVLVYNDLVEAFSPRLVPATADNKRLAIVFAERLLPERLTACYDALALGLEDHPNLEAIYFLSDGEPTAGAIIDMNAIVEAITQQNQLKLVSIYTLGIDARGAHERFLRDLAARNYGEFFLIR